MDGPSTPQSFDELAALASQLDPTELADLIADLLDHVAVELVGHVPSAATTLPAGPLEQAQELDEGYRERAHLRYLSERLAAAVARVEQGENAYVVISMPPRMGKTRLTDWALPILLLRAHSDWKLGAISHDATLSTGWGRDVRRALEQHPELGVTIARDAGAVTDWETTQQGGMRTRSIGGSITGQGFKVLILDDLVKDYAAAHSEISREAVWEWYLSTALPRLEPPYLLVVIGTRWHEDDFIGRLLSKEHEGDPDEWEQITFAAIAETDDDALGRKIGEPLLSPLIDETPVEALSRWQKLKAAIGSYLFAALYQQNPQPSKGAVFDRQWARYWTSNPERELSDNVEFVDVDELLATPGIRLCESLDAAFKKTDDSDFVVLSRWAARGPQRILLNQHRERMPYTATRELMKAWAANERYASHVHERLVEDKANGSAIIDELKHTVPRLIPINPTDSKEARARAVTPEWEAGNVLIPHPDDPGNEWVRDFLDELRSFPRGAHDDQVDAMSQALFRMRRWGAAQKPVSAASYARRVVGG